MENIEFSMQYDMFDDLPEWAQAAGVAAFREIINCAKAYGLFKGKKLSVSFDPELHDLEKLTKQRLPLTQEQAVAIAFFGLRAGVWGLRYLLRTKQSPIGVETGESARASEMFMSAMVAAVRIASTKVLSPSDFARLGANALHNKPGGSRDKMEQIRSIWASGKYADRATCAEQEFSALGWSYDSARKALRNTSDPDPWPARKKK